MFKRVVSVFMFGNLKINTQQKAANSYKPWPPKKIRKTGRSPSFYKGQNSRRGRIAYDKRFPMTGKDVNASTEGLVRGGNRYMPGIIGEERAASNPAVIKYYDYQKEREIVETIPEMIPEFVVPDLTDFKLKPYVSYRVSEDVQVEPRHTPVELYRRTYGVGNEQLKNKNIGQSSESDINDR